MILKDNMLFYDFNLLMTNMNVLLLLSINVRKLVLISYVYIGMASLHNQKWISLESIVFFRVLGLKHFRKDLTWNFVHINDRKTLSDQLASTKPEQAWTMHLPERTE